MDERGPESSSPLVVRLAEVLHEGDWMMAGPEWRWSRAAPWQRAAAFRMAGAVLACWRESPTENDTLHAAIRQNASPRPPLTEARVAAKAERAVRWLLTHPEAVAEADVTEE